MPHPRARPGHPAAGAGRAADRLHSVAIHLLRRLRREDDRSGLSAPRLSALSVIVFGGPLTLGELAALEQVRPPTMTRLVSALESDGLVVREADARDGRLTRVRATARGRTLLTRARARRVA
ncbi:MAG: MarR family transcriptional regulator, partial [Gemmatimonadota bacterium]|nr:MarR family transcriptional regulator [Gemmatimonadota bacterium]